MSALIISKTLGVYDGFSDFDANENVSNLSLSVPGGITGNFFTALWGENELEAYQFECSIENNFCSSPGTPKLLNIKWNRESVLEGFPGWVITSLFVNFENLLSRAMA